MTYKTYNCNSYNIHTIKTDNFKTCHLEIVFRKPVKKEDLAKDALLVDILSENNNDFKTRQELLLYLEDLYKTSFYGLVSKTGQITMTNFILDFISPEYIEEQDYLEKVLKLPFLLIQNPNVTNNEFDNLTFNICQKRNILEVKSVMEDAFRLSVNKTLESLDTPSSYNPTGTVEEIKAITPSSLYEHYKKLLKENVCDIFVIGNLDMDYVVKVIKESFKKRIINKNNLIIDVNNKIRKKVLEKKEPSEFVQTNLNLLFNVGSLNKYERNIVFNIFNYILGSGGITSKLYQEIREKNSYCYAINSMYLKYDGLLLIHVALDGKNKTKAIHLIKKVLRNMKMGKFSDEDINNAINNYEMSLNMASDNEISLLNNYVFHIVDDLPLIEQRIELLKKVTKEEIIKVAKKLKINTIFVLEGKEQE